MDFGAGHDLAVGQAGWGDMAGTPIYMAPEVLSEGAWSPAADLYSLGVLLFFLVTGGYPVEGRTFTDVALAYALGHRRLLVDSRPGLPENFVRIVERALAARDRRYATAGAMMHDLADTIPGSGGRREIRTTDGQTIERAEPPIETTPHAEAPAKQAGGLARLRWVRWVPQARAAC
jgi:serine/threonine protein kinase